MKWLEIAVYTTDAGLDSVCAALDSVGITVNKNAIPDDPQKPTVTSGIRVGTPAVTTRGFQEEDMIKVAHLIALCATEYEQKQDEIRQEVAALCKKYPLFRA